MTETAAINELKTTVSELSKNVGELSANVQTQTATFEGYQKLFELHIETINRDTHTLKTAIKVQDAKFEKFEAIKADVSELRHTVKGMQSYPKTLTAVIGRVQKLENFNLTIKERANGIKWAFGLFHAGLVVAASFISSAATYYLDKR